MFRRHRDTARWTQAMTGVKPATADDLEHELLSARLLQRQARERGNTRDDEDLGKHVDRLLDQLSNLAEG